MPILIILIIEAVLFGYFSDKFGFLNTLAAYWVPTFFLLFFLPFILGALRTLSRSPISTSGKSLNRQLSRVMKSVGFFMLVIPLLCTRVLGVLLLTPGLRHLLLWKFKRTLQTKTNQYFAKFGNGFQFYYQDMRNQDFRSYGDESQMKDVTPQEPARLVRKDESPGI